MTGSPSLDESTTHEHLLAMLRTIGDREATLGQLDNEALGLLLGWTPANTAASLRAAKGRMLIWGIRVGGTPAEPSFEDIELTVQGRRLLIAADS